MKKDIILIVALALFSLITGYLLSSISFVGRTGISLFYTQYSFLKIWWKSAFLVFLAWIILFIIQSVLFKKVSRSTINIIAAVLLTTAVAGLYFSYSDFRQTFSHRWLGERFHLGVYLFWMGWITITTFLLISRKSLEKKGF